MTSLYSRNIADFLRSRPWPRGLIWEVVEFEDQLKFKLYRDNLNALSVDDKIHLAKTINEALSSISKSGIPIYTWVAKGSGRHER